MSGHTRQNRIKITSLKKVEATRTRTVENMIKFCIGRLEHMWGKLVEACVAHMDDIPLIRSRGKLEV